jgi:hypothetical protein
MALTQSTSRQASSSKFSQIPGQFSTPSYLRKSEALIDLTNPSDRVSNSQSDKMERNQRFLKEDDDEIDELMSSDDGSKNKPLVPPIEKQGPVVVKEETPSTPPSIPTPPWLASPLPKLSASEREYTSIRSTSDAPDDNTTHPPGPFARYTSSAQDMLTMQRGYDSATVLGMAEPSKPRFRSMSPPEMDLDEGDDQTNDTPETPNPGTAMQTLGPLTCTTLSAHDAMNLRCQLGHDPHRLNVLGNILKSMTDLMMPNHDMVWNLLVVTEGGYNCPFPHCSRHRDGWSRADRTRAHIYADHLLIRYKCDKW